MVGYIARVSLSTGTFTTVENVVSDFLVPLLLLTLIWWTRGIILTSLWAVGGACLGLVAWLFTWLLGVLFRRQLG